MDTARLSLPPGVNGATATMEMLKTIDEDKQNVDHLCGLECMNLWLEAAAVCEMTFACPYTPGRRLPCRKVSDIGLAWLQDTGPHMCKQMAFVFDFYGTVVYRRAWASTHQEVTYSVVMEKLGVQMDVLPSEMTGGQKTCGEKMYSCTANVRKNNILRLGQLQHHSRVSVAQGETRNSMSWRRPKYVFFIMRPINGDKNNKSVEKVRVADPPPLVSMLMLS